MKFQKSVDLSNKEMLQAVTSGEMRVQRGQWVNFGGEHKARVVNVSKHHFDVVHPRNGRAASSRMFKLKSRMYQKAKRLQQETVAYEGRVIG